MKTLATCSRLVAVAVLALSSCTSGRLASEDIWTAATNGHTSRVRQLLRTGTDVNARNPSRDFHDMTPLHLAAAAGEAEMVRLLLAEGADPRLASRWGFTPLHMVQSDLASFPLWPGSSEREGKRASRHLVGKLLLDAGADVNAKDRFGWTPLHTAALYNNPQLCELLLQRGATLDAKYLGQTPLHWGACMGNLEVVQLLVRAGADIACHDDDGYTPLHYAVERGHLKVTEFLLNAGANVNARGPLSGSTPLLLAEVNHRRVISRLLLSRGADPLIPNECGQCARDLMGTERSAIRGNE